jgi:hypothetical protein
MKQIIFALLGLSALLGAASPAGAACSGAISAITVLESGASVAVTLRDQTTCSPVAVTGIVPATVIPCAANAVNLATASPAPTKVQAAVSGSPPSLNFTAVPGASGMGACGVALQHQDGSNTVSSNLTLTLSDGVTGVVPTSP